MEYEIKSRYGDIHKIVEHEDHYEFVIAENCRDYVRYGFRDTPEHIQFVDPSGGPFIAVGSKLSNQHEDLPDKVIIKITTADGIKFYV